MPDRRVHELMTDRVHTLNPDDDLLQVLEMIYDHHIRHIPVVEGSRLVGILTEADFVRSVALRG